MPLDLSTVEARTSRQDRLTDHRSGIVPDRRNTRAPELRPSGDMRSAARGDGAEELMRTLGLVQKAAGDFAGYANRRFEKNEADNADQGAIDQATGRVDAELEQRSAAYRNSVALGRTMTGFHGSLPQLDEQLRGLIEQQDDPDLGKRQGEVRQQIDKFFNDFALDPETGQLRSFLATPEAKRWLAGTMKEARAKMEGAALTRIEERFNGEALTHLSDLLGAQLDTGTPDLPGLLKILPPTLSDDAVRGAVLTTFQAKSAQLKAEGRYEESYAMIDRLLNDGTGPIRTIDPNTGLAAVAPVDIGTAPSAAPAAPKRVPFTTLAAAVMHVESRGNPSAVSPKGAVGTMQTMPGTLRDPGFGVTPAKDNSPAELERVGKDYLRAMLTRYKGNYARALAAYNAGPGNADKWIKGNPSDAEFIASIPFAETREYVKNVLARAGGDLSDGSAGADSVISDPSFRLPDEPLDPVAAVKANPGLPLGDQLKGGLALRPEERAKLLEYRDQLGREITAEWKRKRAETQDKNGNDFLMRLSGLGEATTPTEIAEAARRGDITPERTRQLLDIVRSDRDHAIAEAEQATNRADRDRDKREETEAEGIVANLMGPVYSGTRSPGQALALFQERAASLNPRVRRAVLGAISSEANGIEAVRKNNPAFVSAIETLDTQERQLLLKIQKPMRLPSGKQLTVEYQRAAISQQFDIARQRLGRAAVDKGDIGKLPSELDASISRAVKPYLDNSKPTARR